jgi:hypothetical protein
MAITSAVELSPTHKNVAAGSFIDTGTVKKSAFNLGFRPKYIKLVNATDRTIYEWFEGMASGTTLKIIADGTVTLDTGDAAIAVAAKDTAISLGATADAWTVYDQTNAADAGDSSHLNVSDEKVFGFTVPAAVAIASKQFYFQAHD